MKNGQQSRRDRDNHAALQSTLQALALELSAARETALDLQFAIGELIASVGTAGGDAIFKLQGADLLAQVLGDLSGFTSALAGSVPGSWRVDAGGAADTLHLRDLADRLSGAVRAQGSYGGDQDEFF